MAEILPKKQKVQASEEQTKMQEDPVKEKSMPLLLVVKQEQSPMQEPSLQKIIYLSSAHIETHDVHNDLDMEEDPATNLEVVLNTIFVIHSQSSRFSQYVRFIIFLAILF